MKTCGRRRVLQIRYLLEHFQRYCRPRKAGYGFWGCFSDDPTCPGLPWMALACPRGELAQPKECTDDRGPHHARFSLLRVMGWGDPIAATIQSSVRRKRKDYTNSKNALNALSRCLRYLILTLLIAAPGVSQSPLVKAVGPIGITVSDMDRSLEFYTHVLGFKQVADEEFSGDAYEHLEGVFGLHLRRVRLKLGDELVELTQYLAPRGRPIPDDSASNDHWFQHIAIIVRDLNKAYLWLKQNKVGYASSNPQTLPDWNKSAAGIKAFYFRDPDGHTLEILQFPEGKGLAKWHKAGDDLFMGIDHTAIVVGHTDASLRFYHDLLGMQVAGESENYGPEQEHLNNVFGAHLRITSMRGPAGPGIEFLEYLAPRNGRPIPADQHANDLAYWQTKVMTLNAEQAAQALTRDHVGWISSGVVELKQDGKPDKEFVVRDPDGHAIVFVQQ